MKFRAPQHKYRAQPTTVDGIRFHSKLESRYYDRLKMLQAGGQVLFFLRQVPFHLPGGIRYLVDFVEFLAPKGDEGGEIRWVDVKGYDTPLSIMKRKQAEEIYPIKITIVTKVT